MPETTSARSQPLRGLRIVEISTYVAAPLGGLTLAQLGADVVRVEPLEGAPDRTRWPLAKNGTSLYWAGLNKGKRSIALDLASTEGRALVADLIVSGGRGGGIVSSNTGRHRDLRFETLVERRPDLIDVQLLGTHDGGTAVDYTVQAGTGFQMLTGPEGSVGPVNHVLPAWDLAAGLYLATGLLAAERHRLLTGEGQQVTLALEDVALATAGNLGYLAAAQIADVPTGPSGNYLYGSLGRDFETKDGGRIMLVVPTTRHWRELVAVTGTEQAVRVLAVETGADFENAPDRYEHRRELCALMAPWFAMRTYDEVAASLTRSPLLWSKYRTFSELADDGASLLLRNPLFSVLDQPGVGPHMAPGSPLEMSGSQASASPAPLVGQHTVDVLRELGLDELELDRLRARGVIAVRPVA
jgi:2-methylfumaryl-CoA isomerase